MRSLQMVVAAVVVVTLASGCSVESSSELLSPAFHSEPTTLIPEEVCSPLRTLPDGTPLEGLALGERRETAVRNAISGDPVDQDGLMSAYDRMLEATDEYALAFEAADEALATDKSNPINVAAIDWRSFYDALASQRRETEGVLELVLSLEALGEDATQTDEYQEAARTWNDAQRAVSILASQIRWSHHRAVVYVTETCPGVPDFQFDDDI